MLAHKLAFVCSEEELPVRKHRWEVGADRHPPSRWSGFIHKNLQRFVTTARVEITVSASSQDEQERASVPAGSVRVKLLPTAAGACRAAAVPRWLGVGTRHQPQQQ